ncbi:NUDIX domain-containing protein [Enterococcus lactis]|uniref:NUDIX domain-containing protein n=1 Tax=Enterococcus TaxID=1350 RepID=UPI0021C38BEB|nr:NUDIX domain-containing protein [Enterococcus sp. DA9]
METNDLRMVEENFQFDIRASGILWNEETDDILLSRENDKQVIQVLLGGAVKRLETSRQAVVREMLEETGYETEIVRLLALIETTFFQLKETQIKPISKSISSIF